MTDKNQDAGRVIIITGGSTGIGRGMANYFGERGFRVAILGRTRDTLDEAQAEVRKGGAECLAFQADVSKREDCFRAVQGAVDAWGKIDVLVNNAGAMQNVFSTTPIDEAEKIFRNTLDVHLVGAFLMMMAAAPHLKRPGGRIVNISSIGAFMGGRRPGAGAYVAAKSGLNALTFSWAREFGPQGITVNAIAPGFIETELTKKWPDERRKAATNDILVGRAGQPADIAAAAYYLTSEAGSFVNGEVLNVNGGAYFIH